MKVLVADDDRASRRILGSLLEKNGHEPILVSDGNEAWEVLRSADSPRVAILDWLMPGIDGESLCKKIREVEQDIPVYIIMLTIKNEKQDIIRGLDAGANDYLSKPYNPGELRARVEVGRRMVDLEADRNKRITALEIHEKRVETLLAEKDILLYEIHHRVKNNMNMIINLLTLQAEELGNNCTSGILRNAVGRIKSMGVLYDRLYRSESLTAISIKEYLVALIKDIITIFPDRYKVELNLDIEDIVIDVQRLSCVGMIVNELVFNSMKYAFNGRERGSISIAAHRTRSGVSIAIEDDGIGMPRIDASRAPDTFGLKLVFGLTEQICGTLSQEPCAGTRFVLEFPINDR
jgi:two-component sensor histidine kinase